MKKFILVLLISFVGINLCLAQQATYVLYDVVAGNGNGVRFWQSDSWKMHMGNAAEYHYGPVTDYSIKTNMDIGTAGRGWTWGSQGATPVAALSNQGNMQIAGTFQSNNLKAWAGNSYTSFASTQLQLSWGGGGGNISYAHAIKSRHNSGSLTGNAIDFYLWQPTDQMGSEGSLQVMSLNGGNVGIGTTSPQSKLDVSTSALTGLSIAGNSSSYTGPDINITRSSSSPNVGNAPAVQFNDPSSSSYHIIQGSTGGLQFFNYYNNSWTERMRIAPSGNVGIGTTAPGSYKLAVEGKIGAREVNVIATNPWPDYVFEKNYTLPTLESIKAYIDQNKHLPEVPSATEVEKNGVNLGEMNALLLKKIEELTLYMMEQQKMIQAQNKEIDILKSKVQDINNKN